MAVKKCKNLSKFSENNTKKIAKRRRLQRYRCNDCNTKIQSKRRPEKLQEIIFNKYIYKRQTLSDLAEEYNKSSRWIQKQVF